MVELLAVVVLVFIAINIFLIALRQKDKSTLVGSGEVILVDGQMFDSSIQHFSFKASHRIGDMNELTKLAMFEGVRSASFVLTDLNDVGLRAVTSISTIENLNLQETEVTDEGLGLLEALPRLTQLRLKGNTQITNKCVPHLLKLTMLENLQIQETSIDQAGLYDLVPMKQLAEICIEVWNDNFTFDRLSQLSEKMPWCTILVKGKGQFRGGKFEGAW